MLNLPIKILIVDDHSTFRYGIRAVLETQTCFKVVAEAGSAKEALDYLEKTDIDLVLLDTHMPDMDGIELASRFWARYPNRKLFILMLAMHDEGQYVRRAMEAGADGYLMKTADLAEIFKTIHRVGNGEKVFPGKTWLEALLALLTPSEKRVLWLSGHREYDTARIASRMGMSEVPVLTHGHNIWQKLKAILPEEETNNPNLLVILGGGIPTEMPGVPEGMNLAPTK
ncbi:DNA-binding response regulator, NarL/FixJ family, contains REC and HTH domains [Nitrosospira multiformis]|uniref:DNA-binding response regulator, NarL/FixJ family, contains REC and HTH domains n=1 Tax=Nitrosospira multiformis TaxID=1231 RepID=A0A1H8EVQ6_9PROT|nr:response regulator transcription factor [Nitrosospira multiformis]SEN23214.1 DNA-binding response regulator, NarL/FixJ family, contains REC and HTH domains [Nitrosospira multiformis]